MPQLNVTELDFDKIKAAMVAYFQAQDKYTDWDFEGSGLSVLMDILAYNTHYNAMLSHLTMNESFLDSAQLRGNVVSRAKELGYIPRSTIAATTVVNIVVTAPSLNPTDYLSLDRGTSFTTVVNSGQFEFVTLDAMQAPLDSIAGTYTFTGVPLKQGKLKRMIYLVDNSIENQTFEIPETNVDTSTLRVRVKSNQDSSDYAIYTRFTSLVGIDASSQIYYVQENAEGRYEIYFGDGTLGKKPISNNIAEVEYVYTDGDEANGATAFTAIDSIGGLTNMTIAATASSFGGAIQESIESVRYNAPLTFLAQNRAVTADDYRAIILKNVGNIETISVWGGEDASTPDYGRVYIAIKPTGALFLTQSEKDNIINNVLKGKNVVSITPLIIDPIYTYISLDVYFKYNPNLTDRTLPDLQAAVRSTISSYNDNNLQRFDGVFRYSQLLRVIDASDPSILNSSARVYMYKDIVPSNNSNNFFNLEYSSPIYSTGDQTSSISSTPFTVGGIVHFLGDAPMDTSDTRSVYMYKIVGGAKIKVIDVGLLYPATGVVVINNFRPDTTDPIRISAVPNSNDLAPKRNQLLDIDMLTVNIVGEIDTIALAGSSGAINYTTPSRTR